MRIIALEEHVVTPLYVATIVHGPRVASSLAGRSQKLGHDIGAELMDIGASRIKHTDAVLRPSMRPLFTGPARPPQDGHRVM